MSQVFGDSKRLVNDYMAASHAIGIIPAWTLGHVILSDFCLLRTKPRESN